MKLLVEMGPVVGLVALCVALELSRATYYRLRSAAQRRLSPALVVSSSLPAQDAGVAVVALTGVELPNPSPEAPASNLVAPGVLRGQECLSSAVEVGTSARELTPSSAEGGASTVAGVDDAVGATVQGNVVALPRKVVPRALSEMEVSHVLKVLNGARFCDLSPAEVYATLLDEGLYFCSERTMYRILAAHAEVRERRNQMRHPAYAAPELMATRPNEVWTWDITKLRGPGKGDYFQLYVILDLYSRYVVGWMVSVSESGEQAEQFIADTCARHGVTRAQLTIHADRGPSMRSKTVALMLADLGVIKSHSRPSVSDDNPYSEAQFKTLKYRPDFPDRFGSLEDARAHCQRFFAWYNTEHHHVGIGLLTPHDVFHGEAQQRIDARAVVLNDAYAAHPERFVRHPPHPHQLPAAVWINKPKVVSALSANPEAMANSALRTSVATTGNAIVKIGSGHHGNVATSATPIVEDGQANTTGVSTFANPIVNIGLDKMGDLATDEGPIVNIGSAENGDVSTLEMPIVNIGCGQDAGVSQPENGRA